MCTRFCVWTGIQLYMCVRRAEADVSVFLSISPYCLRKLPTESEAHQASMAMEYLSTIQSLHDLTTMMYEFTDWTKKDIKDLNDISTSHRQCLGYIQFS